MTLKFLLEKEFKQFFRNKFMPQLVIIFPLIVMLIMPWAATLDIKNIKIAVVDNDLSPMSREVTQKIGNSTYFRLTALPGNYTEAMDLLEYGHADVILEIPTGFEYDLVNFGATPVQISVNAVNNIKGMMGQAYVSSLLQEFSKEKALVLDPGTMQQTAPKVEVSIKHMYNPSLDYKHTMIPGLMMLIMVVLCSFLPAVNIVSEKEIGTIEQINVTPVRKATFILAKLIPFWIMGFVAMTIAYLLAWAVYGLVPAGSLATLTLFVMLFIFTMTGVGLVVSNHSRTIQQAMFLMFFFVVISIMMSGLLTPVPSMPDWAQFIAGATPTKYMVTVMQSVYLKGSGLADLATELVAMALMMAFFNLWAVLSYRKSG